MIGVSESPVTDEAAVTVSISSMLLTGRTAEKDQFEYMLPI